MKDRIEKKQLTILQILNQANKPLGSLKITEELLANGVTSSERTIRFHLNILDKQGLTEYIGKQGRRITPRGIIELSKARVYEKVGFLASKIDRMTFLMNFNLKSRQGTVVVNISMLPVSKLLEAVPLVMRVYQAGYSMGKLIGLFRQGEQIGDLVIPDDHVGIGTVCSMTLNGVLHSFGIPVTSTFGGLLQIKDYKPLRFIEIIKYDGTTIDPLEIFIKSRMTDYLGATSTGNGLIGASFREMPDVCRDQVVELASQLDDIGLGGFLTIGIPGQSLLEIPINAGRIGAIVIGGLNPAAILEEYGIKIQSRALSGLVDYNRMFYYTDLPERVKEFL